MAFEEDGIFKTEEKTNRFLNLVRLSFIPRNFLLLRRFYDIRLFCKFWYNMGLTNQYSDCQLYLLSFSRKMVSEPFPIPELVVIQSQ